MTHCYHCPGSVVGAQLQITLSDGISVGGRELETTPEFMNCRIDDISQEHSESKGYPLDTHYVPYFSLLNSLSHFPSQSTHSE